MFEKWRREVVEPRVFGRVLDVGCGQNKIRGAIGTEIYPKMGNIQCHYDNLPFSDTTFNCVVFMASLNYIRESERESVIREAHRVLRKYGRLVITCTTPIGGLIHRFFRWRQPRGLRVQTIRGLCDSNNFRLIYQRSFMLGLNRLYVFGKEAVRTDSLVQIQKVIKEEIHHENHTHKSM